MMLSAWRAVEGQDEVAAVTLDDLLAGIIASDRATSTVADAIGKDRWSEQQALCLTYGELDEAIDRVATRLQQFRLPVDSIVAIKMPNGVETIVTMMAVIRAGLIPAMLPAGATETDLIHLSRLAGATAMIASGCVEGERWSHEIRRVAGAVFSVRLVFGFGKTLPQGAVPLDDLFAPGAPRARPEKVTREGEAADHVALVTFDNGDGVWRATARNHRSLVAVGLDTALAWTLDPSDAVFTTLLPSGLAGLATGLLPALVTGASLTLSHPFAADLVKESVDGGQATHLVLPAVVGEAMSAVIAPDSSCMLALVWTDLAARLGALPAFDMRRRIDTLVVGQAAVISAERQAGLAAPVNFERVSGGLCAFRIAAGGMIEARGAMVGQPVFTTTDTFADADGWIATRRRDPRSGRDGETHVADDVALPQLADLPPALPTLEEERAAVEHYLRRNLASA